MNERITKILVISILAISLVESNDIKAINPILFNDSINIKKSDTVSYILVEKNAEFNNGDANEFRKYIQSNLKYSDSLLRSDRVMSIIEFVIDKTGQTRSFKIINSSGIPELDIEAIRNIKESPKWTPAIINDKAVNQRMTIPVIFEKAKNK
jgi:TonB family protein